jgi:hypothetical protein
MRKRPSPTPRAAGSPQAANMPKSLNTPVREATMANLRSHSESLWTRVNSARRRATKASLKKAEYGGCDHEGDESSYEYGVLSDKAQGRRPEGNPDHKKSG